MSRERLIESTETRFERALIKFVEDNLRLKYVNEMDFNSPTLSIPKRYSRPVFYVKIQVLPDTRGVPILRLRPNIFIGINRTAGNGPGDQDRKVRDARDSLHRLMRSKKASSLFNTRVMQWINADTNVVQDSIISLTQFEFTIFQINKEY
jgi:hypothetical protein